MLIAAEPGEEGAPKPRLAERLSGVWHIALAAGVAYAVPSLAVAAFVGPELTVVVGSLCSLVATALLAKLTGSGRCRPTRCRSSPASRSRFRAPCARGRASS